MEARIETSEYYFGTQRWTLRVTFGNPSRTGKFRIKRFLLGQDVKYASRVFGCSLGELYQHLGIKGITSDRNNQKMANFIIKEFGLTSKVLQKLNSWDLSCE